MDCKGVNRDWCPTWCSSSVGTSVKFYQGWASDGGSSFVEGDQKGSLISSGRLAPRDLITELSEFGYKPSKFGPSTDPWGTSVERLPIEDMWYSRPVRVIRTNSECSSQCSGDSSSKSGGWGQWLQEGRLKGCLVIRLVRIQEVS